MTTHYFSPGPATLPAAVRDRLHSELKDTFGIGVSILEISHRSKHYETISQDTLALARRVLLVPDSHEIIITPFGAQQHFSLIVHHLSLPQDVIAYTDTGLWAHIACQEAEATGRQMQMLFNGSPDYRRLENPSQWQVNPQARYLHLTVNNTVYGTEYPTLPKSSPVPLVLDMTSSLAARNDIPWADTGVVYASAQKNFGIAGASLVIMRKDLLEKSRELCRKNLIGNALSYASIFDAKSALNTPPVFPIFAMNRYFAWMEQQGGVTAMETLGLKKAQLLYGALDEGFYTVRPEKHWRSRHNFVFNLPTPALDDEFIAEAAKHNILEIKGYRNVGGIRASIYNGVSLESTEALVDFARDFARRKG